jgi:hypothetical protein
MDKEQMILLMLKDGKSYSDIQVALEVSPSRIIVVKKKHFLRTKKNKEKDTTTTATIKKRTKPVIKEKSIEKKETFTSKMKLIKRLRELSGIKLSFSSFPIDWYSIREKTIKRTINGQEYEVERIAYSRYTLKYTVISGRKKL